MKETHRAELWIWFYLLSINDIPETNLHIFTYETTSYNFDIKYISSLNIKNHKLC